MRCNKCDRESVTFDPFYSLSVPLPVPKDRSIVVTVNSKDPESAPKRYMVKVAKNSSVGEMKEKVAEMSGVPHKNLLLVEVYNNKIYKLIEDNRSIDRIQVRLCVAPLAPLGLLS